MVDTIKVLANKKVELITTQQVDGAIHLATLKSNLAHFQNLVAETQAKIKQLEDAGITTEEIKK
jgi:hypothetical protein